ncbi:carboxymuconolactone decarboxylase family protein [Sphingomonas cavernae]|uniref:Carboxymuconolactone decarboxylase family protein n=1 Tax=Sphingomonas cavernae TaxID=2320861 RepID=A0A418WMR4_9SPHN|nr:carboxymuconolactone decarboxylase family protein [Sphingomonas cavernae]RJF91294.1 carboxymuconolactone decarboxylase family protein [Sphingomonas cavernae]
MRGNDPELPPRIPPVPREGWTDEIRQFFAIMEGPQTIEQGTRFNAQAIMANHPELSTAWAHYNKFVARELEIPDSLREIAILRTAWNLQAGYEWYQHRIIGRRCGLSEEQLEALKEGEGAPVWSEDERLVIRAADEICANAEASAETIESLLQRFGPRQLLEILWTIGTYGMLAWIFNSLRIPIEDFCIT